MRIVLIAILLSGCTISIDSNQEILKAKNETLKNLTLIRGSRN